MINIKISPPSEIDIGSDRSLKEVERWLDLTSSILAGLEVADEEVHFTWDSESKPASFEVEIVHHVDKAKAFSEERAFINWFQDATIAAGTSLSLPIKVTMSTIYHWN